MNNILMNFADMGLNISFPNMSHAVTSSNIITSIIILVILCLIATITIEFFWSLVFGIRSKNLGIVVLAQIITNPLVVLISNFVLYLNDMSSYFIAMFILEICAFIAEGFIYRAFFVKDLNRNKMNPFLLSFLLNLFSVVAGLIFAI